MMELFKNLYSPHWGECSTILTYDNYAKRLDGNGREFGTSGSASFFVKGSSFVAEKLTFANTAGITAGQALAININSALSAFKDSRFLGHQDTWFAASGTKQYLKDCYIEGSVDFIFGGSTVYFEACELRSTRAGYITAASTPANQPYGYVFDRCKLTAVRTVEGQSVYLGRPWRPHARVVYLNCEMGEHIMAGGWDNWRNQANEKTAFYAEYQSRGPGYQNGKRVLWSHQLSEDDAAKYRPALVLGSWSPFAPAKIREFLGAERRF
jgi:pectinesterase